MLKIEQNYVAGIPQTTVAGWQPLGLAWHWTAGGTGRAGAQATINHFVATRYTVNASYHILIWCEHRTGHVGCVTVAQWIVPMSKASHSIAPSQAFVPKYGNARETARFAEVRRILGTKASDPNAGCVSISYCGMPADMARDIAECQSFVPDLKALSKQLIDHATYIAARPHFGHGWIQPSTRYELDRTHGGEDMLIGRLYGEPIVKLGDDMQYWKPVQEKWTAKANARFWDGAGNEKFFTGGDSLISFMESSDGLYRLVRYGNEALVVERAGLTVVAGSRVPATGFGYPPAPAPTTVTVVKEVPTGITQAQVDVAVAAARDDAILDEKARLRVLLGLT